MRRAWLKFRRIAEKRVKTICALHGSSEELLMSKIELGKCVEICQHPAAIAFKQGEKKTCRIMGTNTDQILPDGLCRQSSRYGDRVSLQGQRRRILLQGG